MSSRDAIERLMLAYVDHTDAGDWDGVGRIFEHGEFVATVDRGWGGAKLAEARRRAILIHDGSPRTKHITTNIAIDVNEAANTATARSYYTLVQGTPTLPAQVIGAGRYHDSFVREDGDWRFDVRRSYLDLRGDLTQHLRGIAPPSETDHLAPPGGPAAADLPWMPQPKDNIEAITTLMYTYCERMDLGDFEGVGRLFERGAYGIGEQARGSDEVTARLRDRVKLNNGSPRTKHVTTNVDIEVDAGGDTASARSYFWALQAAPELRLQTIAAGRYEDRFERSERGWRFTDRVIVLEVSGDLTQHLPHRAAASPD